MAVHVAEGERGVGNKHDEEKISTAEENKKGESKMLLSFGTLRLRLGRVLLLLAEGGQNAPSGDAAPDIEATKGMQGKSPKSRAHGQLKREFEKER